MPIDLSASSRDAPSRRGLAPLAVSVILFSTSWPVTKMALDDASPLWMASARAWFATVSSFVLLLALGQLRRPSRQDLPLIASIAVLQLAGFFALRHVPAGRSVVLAYTTTLWLLPFGVVFLRERLSRLRALGALVGLAGVAVLFNPLSFDWRDPETLWGNGCLLLAALIWAIAILHTRCHVWRLTPLQLLPWEMLGAALFATTLGVVFERDGWLHATPTLGLALAYLGLMSSPLATWAAVTASRVLPTVVTSLGFLCVPVLGVVLSTVWLGEPLSASLAVGGGLILLGLALVSLG